MQIFHNPNFNFVKYRWPALVGVLGRSSSPASSSSGRRGCRSASSSRAARRSSSSSTRRRSIDQVRTALDRIVPGGGQNVVVQSYGHAAAQPDHGPRAADRQGAGDGAEPGVRGRREGPAGGEPRRTFTRRGHGDRRAARRRRADAPRASMRDRPSRSFGILLYICVPLPVELRGRRVVATIHDLLIVDGVPRVLPGTTCR